MLHPVIMAVPPVIRGLAGAAMLRAVGGYARTALAWSAAFSGVALGALDKGPRGEPLPSGGLHWSLSHTLDFVAAVAAPHPVGIDIERIQPFSQALKERLAGACEWALAPRLDPLIFCRYWTAKEAVLKATGTGLSGLSRCRITEIGQETQLQLSYDSQIWTVSELRVGEGHLAAVSAAADRVEWHLPEGEEP